MNNNTSNSNTSNTINPNQNQNYFYPPQISQNYQNNFVSNNTKNLNDHQSKLLEQIAEISKKSNSKKNATTFLDQHYEQLAKKNEAIKVQVDKYSVLRVCIYLIPILPIFIIIFKHHRLDIMWHARQSFIAQIIWLVVLAILNSTNAPLISGGGITIANLWTLVCIIVLSIAAAKAYLGEFYKIPIVYDVASNFIENTSTSSTNNSKRK